MRKVLLNRGPRSGMPRWQLFHHTSSLALHLNKGPASGPHTKDHRGSGASVSSVGLGLGAGVAFGGLDHLASIPAGRHCSLIPVPQMPIGVADDVAMARSVCHGGSLCSF